MKYVVDHDFHIHSKLSTCSSHPEQTVDNILKYGLDNNLKTICITDHYWDNRVDGASDWYKEQGDIYSVLPLPQEKNCNFLFGCETDMDKNFHIGISKEQTDKFDFIIVSTTHLHMKGFTFEDYQDNITDKTNLYVKRFEAFLGADLPFKKVGLAHITTPLIHRDNDGYVDVINNISDTVFERLFKGCADRGCGVELNIPLKVLSDTDKLCSVMRPYKIAKTQGCKFYLGSDAHNPEGLKYATQRFNRIIDLLELSETDKFHIGE